MNCSICGKAILSASEAASMRVLFCTRCNAVYGMDKVPDRDDGAICRKWLFQKQPGRFRIKMRWLSPLSFLGLLLCMGANAFLVYWFSIAYRVADPPIQDWACWLAFGMMVLTYLAVAGVINRTTYHIQPLCIHWEHGPLPWAGGLTLSRSSIRDVVCRARMQVTSSLDYAIVYDVLAIRRKRKPLTVIRGIPDIRLAVFIEQQMEEQLCRVAGK